MLGFCQCCSQVNNWMLVSISIIQFFFFLISKVFQLYNWINKCRQRSMYIRCIYQIRIHIPSPYCPHNLKMKPYITLSKHRIFHVIISVSKFHVMSNMRIQRVSSTIVPAHSKGNIMKMKILTNLRSPFTCNALFKESRQTNESIT